MAQEKDNFAHRGDVMQLRPRASTDLTSGDYVVMARASDPISRALLGNESQIRPITAQWWAQWGAGIVDADFSTNVVGATKYATPSSDEDMPVIRRGVVRLALSQTSGKAGDNVVYLSGATGAQLFKTNNFRRDVGVGTIAKDFSGATAGDTQQVVLYEKPLNGRDIYFWLQNRVLQGCKIKMHSVDAQKSSQVMGGATGEVNLFIVKGKINSKARVTDFTVGALNPGASDIRFYWAAIKLSTTGAAAAWTKETCTGPFTAIASWTNSVVSAGMMIPITWTSNMIPVALLIGWSNTEVSIGNDRILNLDGFNILPNGTKVVDHEKWYL